MNIGLLKQVIDKLGGNSSEIPDNLLTTHLKAMCEALGIDTSEIKDNLTTTYLKAMHGSDLPDNLLTSHLEALCSTLGIDTSDMEDRLASSYFMKIVGGEVSGGGSGATVNYASQLYEHFGVDKEQYPYVFIKYYKNDKWLDLVFFSTLVSNGDTIKYSNYKEKGLSATIDEINARTLTDYAINKITSLGVSSAETYVNLISQIHIASNFEIVSSKAGATYRLDE